MTRKRKRAQSRGQQVTPPPLPAANKATEKTATPVPGASTPFPAAPDGDDDTIPGERAAIRLISKGWFRFTFVLLLIATPLIVHFAYVLWTKFPATTVVATSQPGGHHDKVANSLRRRLTGYLDKQSDTLYRRWLNPGVEALGTRGSLDNFHLLRYGEVDFAIYQVGTSSILLEQEFRALAHYDPETTKTGPDRGAPRADLWLDRDRLAWQRPERIHEAEKQRDKEMSDRAFRRLDADESGRLDWGEFENSEHDRFIQSLLTIEEQQREIDIEVESEQVRRLQALLEDIAALRRKALGTFTAHQINDEPVVHGFFEMCHYVSVKISDKISRHQLGSRFDELVGGDSAAAVRSGADRRPSTRPRG